MKFYIGYDQKFQDAFDACQYSLAQHQCTTKKLSIASIPQYRRKKESNQSTEFTYSRFFIPYLEQFEGYAFFVDCDFLFIKNPLKIIKQHPELLKYPVSVCKHPQYVPKTITKIDGKIKQHQMPMKNWASLMLFNCQHEANKALTPDYINKIEPGRKLHEFSWLQPDQIGSIPLDWNVLDDYYYLDKPKAIHYTDGGPWSELYQNTMYSKQWLNVFHSEQFKAWREHQNDQKISSLLASGK